MIVRQLAESKNRVDFPSLEFKDPLMVKTMGIGLLGLLCLVGWTGSAFSADDTVVEFEVPAGELLPVVLFFD